MASTIGDFEQRILFALIHLGADAYGVSIRDEIEGRTGTRGLGRRALHRPRQAREARPRLVAPWRPDARARRQAEAALQRRARRRTRPRAGVRIASADGQRPQVETEDSEGVDAARSHTSAPRRRPLARRARRHTMPRRSPATSKKAFAPLQHEPAPGGPGGGIAARSPALPTR